MMCGINGVVNLNKSDSSAKATVGSMNSTLLHRGPDSEGIFTSKEGCAVFGARRLSIVDVANGQQPVKCSRGDSEFSCVLNGEIYNFRELKEELIRKGHKFETDSDTEVVLKSYMEWGKQCVDRFRGIFALAVYDGNELFLARDRLGVKPLYYTTLKDGTLVFSSEPKGIFRHPYARKEPDFETIAEYFLGTFVFTDSSAALNRSFFRNVQSVEPGCYSLFSSTGMQTYTYWDLPIHGERNDVDFVKEFRTELSRAIIEQLPTEVRYGTALSGGLDSSIVTAIAAAHSRFSLPAAAIKFSGSAKNPDFEHAMIFARQCEVDLQVTELTPENLISFIDPMISAMDEPHDTIRQLGLFAVYKKLHEAGCKVVLVGEGSDEFNLGYYHFSPGLGKEVCQTPAEFREAWRRRIRNASRYFTLEFLQMIDFESILSRVSRDYYEKCDSVRPIDRIQYYYAKKFLKYRLDANDRCGMANSIEARVPFCDHRFVELAFQVPPEVNLAGGQEKNVLREAFKQDLPPEIYRRQKYALPESKDLLLYKLIAQELDRNILAADRQVWSILDQSFIVGLNNEFKARIEQAKAGVEINFTGEIRMHEEVDLRIKHVFLALTFLRWFDMNFNSNN
jgi:asparagine synthase (glutamine-hydrolysing)